MAHCGGQTKADLKRFAFQRYRDACVDFEQALHSGSAELASLAYSLHHKVAPKKIIKMIKKYIIKMVKKNKVAQAKLKLGKYQDARDNLEQALEKLAMVNRKEMA